MESRRNEFKKNTVLENYLAELNENLSCSERVLLKNDIKEYPVIFVMGAMRSGTTLLMQWLASTKMFAYPSNFISRFYGAPIVGAKILKLLSDPKYVFRDEIQGFEAKNSFESVNGKTAGTLEPNEFWYFWERFVQRDLRKYTSHDLLDSVNIEEMRREIWGMSCVFDKPFACKGMMFNYHIVFLSKVFPKSIFIFVQRDMKNHVNSVLRARIRQYGTDKEWYSFLIPEYEEIIKIEDPSEQVKTQISCINQAIQNGLKSLPEEKRISIRYEDFCDAPIRLYHEIRDRLALQDYTLDAAYHGANRFISR